MKIIKEGDLSKLLRVKQFRCWNCGCIFEANDTEYVEYDRRMCYDPDFKCNCPICDEVAYEYRSGEH